MSDTSFTFLEIHLGDGHIRIGPKSFGGNTSDSDPMADDATIADPESDDFAGRDCPCPICENGCDCMACKSGKVALFLGILAAIAFAGWKLLGDTDLEAAEDLDELVD